MGFVVVCAIAGDVSDESVMFKALGRVMNFEPSLFVYFSVAFEVGDVGDCTVCWRGFAGIPIRCRLSVGASKDGTAPNIEIRNCTRALSSRKIIDICEMVRDTHQEGEPASQDLAPPSCLLLLCSRFGEFSSVGPYCELREGRESWDVDILVAAYGRVERSPEGRGRLGLCCRCIFGMKLLRQEPR